MRNYAEEQRKSLDEGYERFKRDLDTICQEAGVDCLMPDVVAKLLGSYTKALLARGNLARVIDTMYKRAKEQKAYEDEHGTV